MFKTIGLGIAAAIAITSPVSAMTSIRDVIHIARITQSKYCVFEVSLKDKDGFLNVREYPTTYAPAVTVLFDGEIVVGRPAEKGWLEIGAPASEYGGFISAKYARSRGCYDYRR